MECECLSFEKKRAHLERENPTVGGGPGLREGFNIRSMSSDHQHDVHQCLPIHHRARAARQRLATVFINFNPLQPPPRLSTTKDVTGCVAHKVRVSDQEPGLTITTERLVKSSQTHDDQFNLSDVLSGFN